MTTITVHLNDASGPVEYDLPETDINTASTKIQRILQEPEAGVLAGQSDGGHLLIPARSVSYVELRN